MLHGDETRVSMGARLARGVCRALTARGHATLTEFTLKGGRRADVVAIGESGEIDIVEVKSSLADYRSDGKWGDYLAYCDRFHFAVPRDFPLEVLPGDCGVMIADPYDAEVLRPAPEMRLNAARRRAMVIRFARVAGQRLTMLTDPPTGAGW